MVKAVFFDLDETLINAEHAHQIATERAFHHFGYDYAEVRKKTPNHISMGKRVSDNLKARRDGAGILESEIPFQKLLSLREGYFLEYMEKEAIILEGAGEIVKRMKSKNILSAIVSSGTHKYLYLVLKKFNLEDSIDFIVSGDDVLKGKPDPECYLTAFNKAIKIIPDLKTEECLVFEDTEAGVTAGKNAGMKVVLIPTLTSIMPTVVMPDYIIDSLLNFKDSMLE